MILHLKQPKKRKQEDTKIQQTFSGNLNALVAGMLFFQSIAHNPSPNQDDHDGTRPNSVVAVLDPSWKAVVSLEKCRFHADLPRESTKVPTSRMRPTSSAAKLASQGSKSEIPGRPNRIKSASLRFTGILQYIVIHYPTVRCSAQELFFDLSMSIPGSMHKEVWYDAKSLAGDVGCSKESRRE